MSKEETINNSESRSEEPSTLSQAQDAVDKQDAADENSASAQADSVENVDSADNAAEESKKQNKAKSSEKQSRAESGKGMSKLFKLIYYPVLAVFVLIMLIFSAVDGVYGYKPKTYGSDYYTAVNKHIETLSANSRSVMSAGGTTAARDYIVGALEAGGFYSVVEVKNGEEADDEKVTTVTDWAQIANAPAPTVTMQSSDLTAELQTEMGVSEYLVGARLTNIVAAIPSLKTRQGGDAGAVIITVRYDTRTDSVGAAQNAAFVANAVQTLIEYKTADVNFENDLIVVFTEDLDGAYGSRMFFNAFDGLGDAVSRAKVGLNLDAYGNGGTLALTDASGAGLDYINAYTKVSGSVFDSSAVRNNIPAEYKNLGAVDAFGDIPALQVAVLGGLDGAQSALDTAANLSESVVYQQARFIKSYIDAFANTDKSYSAESDNKTVFFSYLDGGTVAYDSIASYVIGAIILAVAAAAITVIAVKKAHSVKNMFTAAGVMLLSIVGTLAAMFAAYFLVTLMLAGFGVLPIHLITRVTYFNGGILLAAMLVALAGMFGFSTLFKKLFKVTASDCVRGTAILFGAVGAVMSFAAPEYSFLTSWVGLLSMIVLLVTACVKNLFKNRFGFGTDRLFLYTIPVALCLPLIMSNLTALTQLLPLYVLPLNMTLFAALLGVAVPYLDRTKDVFDKLAKKLPMRTIRVEHTVTEKVEDRAKKGKFTERTFKRVDKEKVAVNYKNYFGVSVVAVIGVIVALFSGGFGVSFGKSIVPPLAYDDAVYNDALVYEWEKTGDRITQKIVVDDLLAYKYIRYAVTDLDWHSAEGRYSKSVNYNIGDIVPRTPGIARVNERYEVTTFDGPRSTVTITVPSASAVTKITVINAHDVEYVYSFANEDTIVLRLPYGFGDFELVFEGGNPTALNYEEHRTVNDPNTDNALANVDEWNMVLQRYRGQDIANKLRGGIVLKLTETFA